MKKNKKTGRILYKTLSYSTYDSKLKREENRYQPKHVARELNMLSKEGWFIYYAFNTESKIELLLAKEEGKLSLKERMEEEQKQKNKELAKRGFTSNFNFW